MSRYTANVGKSQKSGPVPRELKPDKKSGRGRNGGPGRFEVPIKFDLPNVYSPGTKIGKFGSYSIAIVLEKAEADLLWDIADRNGAILTLYGREENILYLTAKEVSERLQKDLTDSPMMLRVKFEVSRTYESEDGPVRLGVDMTGAKKLGDAEAQGGRVVEDLD